MYSNLPHMLPDSVDEIVKREEGKYIPFGNDSKAVFDYKNEWWIYSPDHEKYFLCVRDYAKRVEGESR